MKHVLVGVCIALLAFGLAACSGSSTATPVANPPSTPIQPSSQADQSNMVTTASGLKSVDLIVGAGAMPNKTDWVTVNYTGTL